MSNLKIRSEQYYPMIGIVLCLLFLFIIAYFSTNTFVKLDDSKILIHQFDQFWLNQPIGERLKFFFKMTNWPHPQIITRIFSLVSYYSLGEINFRLIVFLGNICIPGIIYYLYKLINRDSWIIIPIAIVITSIFNVTFWAVGIIGYGWLILLFMGGFYNLSKGDNIKAIMLLSLATFSSGIGVATFGFSTLFCVLTLKKYKLATIHFSLLLVLGSIFYFGTLEGELIRDSKHSVETLLDYTLALKNTIKFNGLWGGNFYSLFIGILGIVAFFFFLFRNSFKNNSINTLLFVNGFILLSSILAAYAGMKRGYLNVPDRYIIFSCLFWINLVIITYESNEFHLNLKYVALLLLIPSIKTPSSFNIEENQNRKSRTEKVFKKILQQGELSDEQLKSKNWETLYKRYLINSYIKEGVTKEYLSIDSKYEE